VKSYVVSTFRITLAAVLATVLYFAVTLANIVYEGNTDPGGTADVIVVMGAAQYDGRPSPLLQERLSTALQLWSSKRAPLIAVTGGKQDGDRFTEAEASQRWLVDRGVPESSIVMETVGESTWQSLSELAPLLRERNVSTAIVVSSDWHVSRASSTLRELGFRTDAVAMSHTSGGSNLREWARETVGVGLGRLIGFDSLFSLTG
jgi:uncharacterized SAM-binding protein YcdF (DUF218 family)